MEHKKNPKKAIFKAALLIIAVTAAAYAGSLKNGFIWDDAIVIENNDFVRSWKNFPSLFSRSYLTPYDKIGSVDFYSDSGSGETSYRPVVTASYFLDYRLWGLKAFGFHLTSLFLHILNTLLLLVFFKRLTGERMVAVFAALLFALHPVNSEAVGVISFREDLLVFFFYLSSLLFYIKQQDASAGRRKALLSGLSLVSFLLALFSKEMAISLPLTLMLYDYFFVFKQQAKKLWINFKARYAGYILALLFYLYVAFFAIGRSAYAPPGYPGGSLFTGIMAMPKVFAVYLQWLFLPFSVHVTLPDDPLFIGHSLFGLRALLSALLPVLIIIFALRARKTSPIVSFAVFWFFITLLPVSNIVPIMNYIACRYLYIPTAGFCLGLAVAARTIMRRKTPFFPQAGLKKIVVLSATLLLVFYFVLTSARNATWKDNVGLWSEMVKVYPQNALAHSGLAGSLMRNGQLGSAALQYKKALNLDPLYAKDHNDLGACYFRKMMLDNAIREFRRAIELDPGSVEAYNNLGSALGEKGLYGEAMVYFNRAININNKYVLAYNGIAITYARMEKFEEAKMFWQKALEIDPGNAIVRDNLEKLARKDE